MHSQAFIVAALASAVIAAPASTTTKLTPTCTFSGTTGAAAASASAKSCATIILSNIIVPANTTLNLTKLADDTTVIFEGTTTWGYAEWVGPLVSIGGNRITIKGAPGAVLNPDGARWWDGLGGNGGKTKPKYFAAHNLVNSTISDLNTTNTPVQGYSIASCNNLTLNNIYIDNSAGDVGALGHNTDAFDIGTSSNVVVDGARVYNQDDCVAINSGDNITFKNGFCSGGHGLSIGSVGGRALNTVDKVAFLDSVIQNSDNGIRIKTVVNATGLVSNVIYRNITLRNIAKRGILIEQNYNGGDLKGVATNGLPITNLTIADIDGANGVVSSGYDVTITCGVGSCTNWTWNNVTVTGGKTYADCSNVPSVTKCS